MSRLSVVLPTIALPAALLAASAGAQEPPDAQRIAAAQALFDDASARMAAGDFTTACPKLEEVVRLAPSGVGAKLKLAECYERAGRLASAWTTYVVARGAARMADQPERELWAEEHANALKPRLSELVVVVPDALRTLEGLRIRRDGIPVGPAQWGVPVPVDGGEHTFDASAPNKVEWTTTITIAPEQARATVNVPALADEPAASEAPAPPAPPLAPVAIAPSPLPPQRDAASTHAGAAPLWPWLVGGAGIALVGAGIGFRLDVESVQSRQETACGGDLQHCARTSPSYDPEPDNARKHRDFAAFVALSAAGVIATGAGVVGLVVTRSGRGRAAPEHASAKPCVLGAGAGVCGAF